MRGRLLALVFVSIALDVAACVGDDPSPGGSGSDAGSVEGGTPPAPPPGTPPPTSGDSGSDAAPPTKPCDPTAPFSPSAPVTELNGTAGTPVDADARLSADQRTIYWTTNRENPSATTTTIYTATRSSITDPFGTPQPVTLSVSLGTPSFNGPTFAADPNTLFYGVGGTAGAAPFYEVATSTKSGANWSTGVEVDPARAPSGTQSALGEPYLTPDGLTIVYHGDAVLTAGGSHYVILQIDRDATGSPFTNPKKTIDEIESDYNQAYPILSKDKRAIYFATDRISADAGDTTATYDIWVATRSDPNGAFGAPVPVQGGNVNADGNDQPTWISDDQCTLYFNTHRFLGGVSARRIFKATRTPPP